MSVIKINNNGQIEEYTLGIYATMADCSVMQKVGGSVVLCTLCIDMQNSVQEGFIPLSVQYNERMYAVGKIPHGFTKREGKPSDSEILASRLIDRSLRPLFPKDFPYPVQITLLVLSYDGRSDLYKDCINLASICLFISEIPVNANRILNATRVMRFYNKLEIPNHYNLKDSSLDLLVSGIDNELSMIEMQVLKTKSKDYEYTNELGITQLMNALYVASSCISENTSLYTQAFLPFVKQKIQLKTHLDTKQKDAIKLLYKDEITSRLRQDCGITKPYLVNNLIKIIANDMNMELSLCAKIVDSIKRDILRESALQGKRIDGRKTNEVRYINIASNILPFAHGSACFMRGQTQALVTCTIGSNSDMKTHEGLIAQKRGNVILHYNFPPFSVGEAMPIMQISRRELGHGNLALKAIESNISDSRFIRIVSEILQSNGSSSMATVCGATLALKAADIKMKNMVAGIAMGLVVEGDKYCILSDINELEDAHGDMDFKVAGSSRGFSALQLDIKIPSISLEILCNSLQKARFGIDRILSIMGKANVMPNYNALPKQLCFNVPSGSISDIIGQGGKVIRDIIATFEVSIDIDKDNGVVNISGSKYSSIKNAKKYILEILKKRELPYKIDDLYQGVIKKIIDSGILVDLPQGGVGILRKDRVESINDFLVGNPINVRIASNANGKVELDLDMK